MRIEKKRITISGKKVWVIDINGYWGPTGCQELGITEKEYIDIIFHHNCSYTCGCYYFISDKWVEDAVEEFKVIASLVGRR